MSREDLPLVLIEVVLIFGGVLLFGWWQLRSVRRDRDKAQAERAARAEATRVAGLKPPAEASPPGPDDAASPPPEPQR